MSREPKVDVNVSFLRRRLGTRHPSFLNATPPKSDGSQRERVDGTVREALDPGRATRSILRRFARRLGLDSVEDLVASKDARKDHDPAVQAPLVPPGVELMKSVGENLLNRWYLHYFTRKSLITGVVRNVIVVDIDPKGACVLTHPDDPSFRYEGIVYFEPAQFPQRFLLIADCRKPDFFERIVYRFARPSHASASEVPGVWIGIDFGCNMRCGPALLARRNLGEAWNPPEIDGFWAGPPPAGQIPAPNGRAEILPMWRDDLLAEALTSCSDGEEVQCFSTYYPEPEFGTLARAIKALGERIRTASDKPKKRPAITIFFLNPFLRDVIKTRFRGFVAPPDFRKLVADAVERFLTLKSEYAKEIALEVLYYDSWPYGHCFVFGRRIMYFAALLPDNQALTGPMLVLRDPNSPMWRTLVQCLAVSRANAKDCAKAKRGQRPAKLPARRLP